MVAVLKKRLTELAALKEFEDLAELPQNLKQVVHDLEHIPAFSWTVFARTFVDFMRNEEQLEELYKVLPVQEVLKSQYDVGPPALRDVWSSVGLVEDWIRNTLPTIDRKAQIVHPPPALEKTTDTYKISVSVQRNLHTSPYLQIALRHFTKTGLYTGATVRSWKSLGIALYDWVQKKLITLDEMIELLMLLLPVVEVSV